ncbi:MAG: hypothetical protein N5P05_000624 [Chroococcopsis gigantea SAG 12.99]|jgi:hypothetical protein|nr:hypothetical protein [Chroococcopsis gigantea SAG 12.99]
MTGKLGNGNRWKITIVLLLGMAITITQYYNLGMIALTTFVLAYLSKGIRRAK